MALGRDRGNHPITLLLRRKSFLENRDDSGASRDLRDGRRLVKQSRMDTGENEIKDLDAEDLAPLARRYYATRFPNPQRLGCPSPGEITKVAPRRRAPDQALRERLFKCSECFGEYRQALA
jgi:hypothetical protein